MQNNKPQIRSPSWNVQQVMSLRCISREYHVAQYVVLHHFYYEYHYSPHKLPFQNIMRASDQKLMINLEWPYSELPKWHYRLELAHCQQGTEVLTFCIRAGNHYSQC